MKPTIVTIEPGVYSIEAVMPTPGGTPLRVVCWHRESEGWTAEVVQGDGWVDARLLLNGVAHAMTRRAT